MDSYKKKLTNMSNCIHIKYRLYKIQYPDRPCPEHKRFYILYKNLEEYGSFTKPKSRASTVANVGNSFSILAKLNENPHTSLRTLAGFQFFY